MTTQNRGYIYVASIIFYIYTGVINNMEKKTQVTLSPGMALASVCMSFIIHFILWIVVILNSYAMPMPGRIALVIFILLDFGEIFMGIYDRFRKFVNSNK